MSNSPKINFVVALDAEAQPLIHHFKLKRAHSIFPFPVYANSEMQLIVCGIGKLNAAIATGYLSGLMGAGSQAWINFGIAGGDAGDIGDILLANVILDQETNRRYYPSICFDVDLLQAQVITVNKPDTRYQEKSLYDLEAAGFFAAASHFSSSELIHSCKIISDNSLQGIEGVSKESVHSLVGSRVNEVEKLVQVILEAVSGIWPEEGITHTVSLLIKKYHFTSSQQNTLKLLVQNWTALNGAKDLSKLQQIEARNSRQYLEALNSEIAKAQISYEI